MKKLAPLLLALLGLAACSSSPTSLAENHLKLLVSNKSSEANQQYCMTGETLRLHSLKSFHIANTQKKTRDSLEYTEVTAKIDTDQYRLGKSGKELLQQVTLEVWNSEDFYQYSVKSTAKLNDLGAKTATLTGTRQVNLAAPAREKVNKASTCVFLPFDQFENSI
ncbi:MAG: hypothetical protein J0L70_30755 [Leptolyngbya sp. UWPOB_LEPTO1]|uniref:hypothetical protein n=1 Tax=Leptolyngbya sp. UWPOB_LEPTO1 TaxID=2815653 RepID=UPI001AC5FA03|nr:hypothetical protein [Leptolyngbya sp. UWPOB_LEPTO1]MBN8564901.1 hypothetical protein [Leptolyngbya sp. UWPOB_LEPTO1]